MQIRLPDAADTEALGRRIAPLVAEACRAQALVIHLQGPLGAGKTTLARGLLRGLGHAGRVRSPSFTLLEPYELASCMVSHLDLYRVVDPGELDYLGLADQLAAGAVMLVEWPERGADRLPAADLRIALDYEGAGRRATLAALTPAGREVLARLACRSAGAPSG